MRPGTSLVLAVVAGGLFAAAVPDRAAAAPVGSACRLPGLVQASAGPCPRLVSSPPAARSDLFGGLLTGLVGKALAGIGAWVDEGAAGALRVTASLMTTTTRPALQSTWFSAAYWRVGTLSTLLTLPFLFAAGVHALVRSDLAMLGRAAFGLLPLAMLGVAIAAPLTMLMLRATDEMCAFVAAAGGHSDSTFFARAAADITTRSLVDQNPFVAFVVGLITVAATLSLWMELLIRAAAVDVIVLLLPLFFAAMVWPARRVWAVRAIETLIALILSKLAIVAVLTLGGGALAAVDRGGTPGLTALLTGTTLILLAVLSPWALLRLLPLHEVAAAAAGGLSQTPRGAVAQAGAWLPRRTQAEGPASGGDGSGLGAEDDAGAALVTGIAPRLPGGPGARPLSMSDADDGLDAETRRGLAAPRHAGMGSQPTHTGTLPVLFTRLTDDDRPPINEAFAGRPWVGQVLGEHGDEVMEAPRFAAPEDGPAQPPPADEPPEPEPPPADPPGPERS
jgi:hypothetical protein